MCIKTSGRNFQGNQSLFGEEENEDEKCLRKKVTVVVHCKAQRSKGHTSKFFLEHTEKCDAPQPEI